MSAFVALVWCSTFAVCTTTKGLVGSTSSQILAATAELGEWGVVGTWIVWFSDAVLAAAALAVYAALWLSWVRGLPPLPRGAPAAAREAYLRLAIASEVRVAFHLALVIFAVGNFPPLGWAGLAAQVAAAAALVMALVLLARSIRAVGPPTGEFWLVGALILAMSAATGGYVAGEASAPPSAR